MKEAEAADQEEALDAVHAEHHHCGARAAFERPRPHREVIDRHAQRHQPAQDVERRDALGRIRVFARCGHGAVYRISPRSRYQSSAGKWRKTVRTPSLHSLLSALKYGSPWSK